MNACVNGHTETVRALLAYPGIDLDVQAEVKAPFSVSHMPENSSFSLLRITSH